MGSSPIFRIIQKKVLTDVKSLGIISVIARKSISTKCDMRKCRNWQTSKTKDLVSIALVWVQVPSSAFLFEKPASGNGCGFFAVRKYLYKRNLDRIYRVYMI